MAGKQINDFWALSIERLNDKLQKWTQQISYDERRLSPRFSTDLQAHIIYEENNLIMRSQIAHLSDGGFAIYSELPTNFETGQRVQVKIFLPNDITLANSKIITETHAKVKRNELILGESQYYQKLAFEFETPQHIIAKLTPRNIQNDIRNSVYFG